MVLNEKISKLITKDIKNLLIDSWRKDKTNETFEQLLHKNSNKSSYWLDITTALEKFNKVEDANKIYQYLMNNSEIKKAQIAEEYARFCSIHLDITQTKTAYKEALKYSSRKAIKSNFAKYLFSKNELEEAEIIYLQARKQFHSSIDDFNLAEIYLKTKRVNQAINVYKDVIKRLPSKGEAWRLLKRAEELLRQQDDPQEENQIIKSISFKSEHQKAGITILQNFGSLLNNKYPEGGVAFTIKQEGLKVVMVIDHPEGEKEVVEDYLNRYGLVVTGKISPKEFSSDPLMVMDLKRQLIHLKSELEWGYEKQSMLANTIQGQDRQIETLTNQLDVFQNQLSSILTSQDIKITNQHIEITRLIDLIESGNNKSKLLIQPLIDSINNNNEKEIQNALTSIKNNDSSLFQKLNDMTLSMIASSGANAPAWISYLSKCFP